MNNNVDCYINKLKEALYSGVYSGFEIDAEVKTNISLAYMRKYSVWVYGCGKDVEIFILYLLKEGLTVDGIVDKDENKQGQTIEGIKIVSPIEFVENKKNNNKYVFIYTLIDYKSIDMRNVIKLMIDAKVVDYYFMGFKRYDFLGILPETAWIDEERYRYYKKKEVELINTLSMLSDDESKKILIEYIYSYMTGSPYRMEQLPERMKYFYDKNGEKIYRHLENEIWVNFGANVGDTIFYYLRNGLRAKRIIAVECNYIECLLDNVRKLEKTQQDIIEIMDHIVCNDHYYEEALSDKGVTLINADIEGHEIEMLHQMKKIIIRERPVLAICVYHRKEDLIEIPAFINSIAKDYSFFMRKYVAWAGNTRRNYELVFYAVPNERL